ncbi:MAG: MFS transporter [Corynebacterium sp.]|nr:MFS transporter [Corynebacterium sp.]
MDSKKTMFLIAGAVIILELIGGMQVYLGQLIMPIMGEELNARSYYGLMNGISHIAGMIGLPIGAMLLGRVRLSRLLMGATIILIIGAITCATAQNVWMYLTGSVIRSLAGSAMAMTSIGAVAKGLTGRARQLTLAFSSASWVISSLVGPMYAAWVTHLLSWRWAMLMYLPLVLVARFIIALNLHTESAESENPIPYSSMPLLIAGISLTILPVSGTWRILCIVGGVLLLARATVMLMPKGTFRKKTPRRSALAGMFFLSGGYFAADTLMVYTAHDLFEAGPEVIGMILMGGGLGWAILGVICGIKPARSARAYRIRAVVGLGLILLCIVGTASLLFSDWEPASTKILFVSLWTIAGIGMGLVYLDTLNIFFEEPDVPDGISIEEMAASSVMAESLSDSIFGPMISSIVAMAFLTPGTISAYPYHVAWVLSGLAILSALYYLSRAQPPATKMVA